MLANTAVIHVLITTVNIALLLVDNYNESCIIMAWSAVHNTCSHLLNVQRYKAVISHIGLVRLSCSKMESSNPDLAPKLAKLSKVF